MPQLAKRFARDDSVAIRGAYFALSGPFGIHSLHRVEPSYVARNNRRRTMYKFVSAQVTNTRFAFFSSPR